MNWAELNSSIFFKDFFSQAHINSITSLSWAQAQLFYPRGYAPKLVYKQIPLLELGSFTKQASKLDKPSITNVKGSKKKKKKKDNSSIGERTFFFYNIII